MIFSTDFESGIPLEFSGAGVLTATEGFNSSGFGSFYLRNSTVSPISATTLSLGNLGSHTSLTISFDLAVIDSWDGIGGNPGPDTFQASIDGNPFFMGIFANESGSNSHPGTPIPGAAGQRAQSFYVDSAYSFSFVVPHSASTLQLDWTTLVTGWQGEGDESWAIDNLLITSSGDGSGGSNVPEGGSAMLMLALSALALGGTRLAIEKCPKGRK